MFLRVTDSISAAFPLINQLLILGSFVKKAAKIFRQTTVGVLVEITHDYGVATITKFVVDSYVVDIIKIIDLSSCIQIRLRVDVYHSEVKQILSCNASWSQW